MTGPLDHSTKSSSALRKRRQSLLRKLPPLDAVLRGSLIERYKRCGNPGCKCADGPGHGPKYYLSGNYSALNRRFLRPPGKLTVRKSMPEPLKGRSLWSALERLLLVDGLGQPLPQGSAVFEHRREGLEDIVALLFSGRDVPPEAGKDLRSSE
jgi:hypothetical protein